MVKIKFIVETDMMRDPKLALKIIKEHILAVCGDWLIEFPKGYLTKEDLEKFK